MTSRACATLPNSTQTKLGILQLLAEYFCLRTNETAELLRNRPITESDGRSVRRTLAILHRDGLLWRAPHLDFGRERGGVSYAYGLSKKGVAHAFQNGYATPATKALDGHSLRTLDHQLEITCEPSRSIEVDLGRRGFGPISGFSYSLDDNSVPLSIGLGGRRLVGYGVSSDTITVYSFRRFSQDIIGTLFQ